MSDAVFARGLRKSFGRTRALDGLDLSVRTGEVHGFLGPNGAGKTTTIRILLGLLRADDGELRLLDGDPWRDTTALHRRLAYVPAALLFGTLLGSIGQSMSRFVDTPELHGWAARMGATNAGDAFLFIILYVLGQVASAYAIMATLRMRSEEVEGRADAVLATPVRRLSWALSHLFFAAIGPTIALAALGLTMGVGYGLGAGDVTHQLPRLVARAMVTLPACWVMAGIATALYGLLPRFAMGVSWAVLGVFLALELAWELQRVSQSIFDVSPFAHVHWATPVSLGSLIGLTVVAALLTTLGLFGFQRRDLIA